MKQPTIEKTLVMSDIHFDVADEPLVDLIAFKFGKWYKPDNIFLNGDVVDFYSLSRFAKHPAHNRSAEADVARTRRFLQDLRKAHPKARIVFQHGNHSYRLDAYLANNAPEVYPFVTINRLLGLKELDIEEVSSLYKENSFVFHDILVGHFDRIKTDAGQTAMALMKERGCSVIQGHVHRAGVVARTLHDGTVQIGVENPCLAKTPPEYAPFVNWAKGATILETYDGVTFPHLLLVRPIGKKRGFVYDGTPFVT